MPLPRAGILLQAAQTIAARANSNNITQGQFQEMRIMKWAGRGWACAVVMAATSAAAPANAQELSEKATLTFMQPVPLGWVTPASKWSFFGKPLDINYRCL